MGPHVQFLRQNSEFELNTIESWPVRRYVCMTTRAFTTCFFFCLVFVIRRVCEKYCEAMSGLSLSVMELLGISLGVGKGFFREFFEENDSIMRLNYYPPCQKPDLALGTGPHCDPTSLTILHQDHVGGLQVFVDEQWHSITPNPQAFVVNIGDTFMVCFRPPSYIQLFHFICCFVMVM